MEEPTDFCNKCYKCKHRGTLVYSAHSKCTKNPMPKVEGDPHGINSGWFNFPANFDPVWLEKCDSFENK